MTVSKSTRPVLDQRALADAGQHPEGRGAWLSRLSERYAPYWLLLPALLCMVGILIYPLLYSLYVSFYDYRLARTDTSFIGLGNYIETLTSSAFYLVLGQNILWTRSCTFAIFVADADCTRSGWFQLALDLQ